MNIFTLSIADGLRGKPKNKGYTQQASIASLNELLQATQFDHVIGIFKDNERRDGNFISADAIVMDCDNDNTDQPDKWLTPAALAERLPDVAFYVVFSRNHMKVKHKGEKEHEKSARPRWHVYFPLSENISKAAVIRSLKERLLVLVPEFDSAAKDAARLFYGVEQPQGETYEGSLCIDEYLIVADVRSQNTDSQSATHTDGNTDGNTDVAHTGNTDNGGNISEGHRHTFLLNKAHECIKMYGIGQKAQALYYKAAEQCNPPSPVDEVNKIWADAVAFVNAIREKQERKVVTLPIVEKLLQHMGISVGYDVINKKSVITGIPAEHLPQNFYSLPEREQKEHACSALPLILQSHFKEQSYSNASLDVVKSTLSVIVASNPINPVRDMLMAEKWDGIDRIEKLHILLGLEYWTTENIFRRTFLEKWLHQAVALALNDEGRISPNFVLILQGEQGAGKTTFFKLLATRPEWFLEGRNIDLTRKDSLIEADKAWILELGELDATLKRDQALLKSIITAGQNTYRPPYAHEAINVVRRTAYCGTLNPAEALRDDTGSRRFAFITLKGKLDRVAMRELMTPDWCAMVWRQVYEKFYLERGADAFYLDDDDLAFSEAQNVANFTVPSTGEIELRDGLDWDSDVNTWVWYKLTELMDRIDGLREQRVDSRTLSRTIQKILRAFGRDPVKEGLKRIVHGVTQYKLPQKDTIYADNSK